MSLSALELQAYLNEANSSSDDTQLSPEEIAFIHLQEQNELSEIAIEDSSEGLSNSAKNSDLDPQDLAIYNNIPKLDCAPEFRYETRRQIERKTAEEALNQTYLDLNTMIGITNKRLLISFLVNDYTIVRNRYKDYIDRRFNLWFRRFIPKSVLLVWQKYPNMCVPCPDFTYHCSKEYGQELEYTVSLNLPMYFRPEICESLFKAGCSDKISIIDRAISRYYINNKLKIDNEVKHAKTLISISTYYQLLKKQPYWYYLLVSYLKEKNKWT